MHSEQLIKAIKPYTHLDIAPYITKNVQNCYEMHTGHCSICSVFFYGLLTMYSYPRKILCFNIIFVTSIFSYKTKKFVLSWIIGFSLYSPSNIKRGFCIAPFFCGFWCVCLLICLAYNHVWRKVKDSTVEHLAHTSFTKGVSD